MWSISDELCAKENELEKVPRAETGDIFFPIAVPVP